MIQIIVLAVLSILALLGVLRLVQGFLSTMRYHRQEPYRPVPQLFPPVPVVKRPSAYIIGVIGIAWAVAHIVFAIIWLATDSWDYLLPHDPASGVVVSYAVVAGLLVGVGGLMMMAALAVARKLIAWGAFLGGVLSFFGAVMSLLLPRHYEASAELRENAMLLTLAFGAYFVVDLLIGWLGQRVARPAEYQTAPPTPR
jgi:hypothetical protein